MKAMTCVGVLAAIAGPCGRANDVAYAWEEYDVSMVLLSVHPTQGGGQWEWSDEGGAESVSWLGGGLGIDIHLGSGGVNSRM